MERPPQDASRPLGPWLRTVALNLSRDRLRRRRETHVGSFVPEPVLDSELAEAATPEARVSARESASWAFLLALEALSDKQRAVLVLRDVYDLSTRETAEALELGESHVKVLLHRARKALEQQEPAGAGPTEGVRDAMMRFFTALAADDVEAMKALLREDVVFVSDGAGEVFAARKPVVGAERVMTFHRKTRGDEAPAIALERVNGVEALVYRRRGEVAAGVPAAGVVQLEVDDEGRIARILAVVAPSKLRRFFDGWEGDLA
jgi:RNA polymerase sigma-70 factor (ECF subfamily)